MMDDGSLQPRERKARILKVYPHLFCTHHLRWLYIFSDQLQPTYRERDRYSSWMLPHFGCSMGLSAYDLLHLPKVGLHFAHFWHLFLNCQRKFD